MNTHNLRDLTKSQLINLLIKQSLEIKKLLQQHPIPAPRKSVKQMVQDYEDNIIEPPLEFRDDYKPTPKPRTKKPTPLPRTKIEEKAQAMKGYTKSFEIGIKHNKDPLAQLQSTRKAIEYHITKILTSMKGLKTVETLKVTFKKMSGEESIYKSAYFNSKPQTIINKTKIYGSLQLSEQEILNLVAQWISEGSGWIVESVDNQYINFVQYEPLKGSSYIKLPQELRHHRKGLINMKNEDDECFRWCHIRHLNPQDKDSQRIKKVDKQYVNNLDYSGIEFPIYKSAYFNSKPQTIINKTEIYGSLQLSEQEILNLVAQWISEGSGWIVESVDNQYINFVQYEPLKGSSYIKLPQELRHHRKGLINMKNEDDECFRWCHIRHLNPQDKDSQRIKKVDKQYVNNLDYSGIEFPVTTKQYNKIEKQNDININVFGYENKQPYPIYVSKEKYDDHMELLLITENENKHYVLIKDFNRFMYNQTKHKESKHFCMYCLQCFSSETVLTDHKDNCIIVNGTQAVKMPQKGNNILKYNNFHKQQQVPFVIYADFEAITEKISGCHPNNNKSYTEAYQKHTDCGFGYKLVCCYDDKYSKPLIR